VSKHSKTKLDSEIFEAICWGIRHDAFESEWHKTLLRNHQLGVSDPRYDGMLSRRVLDLKIKEALGESNPFRKPRLDKGDGFLGFDDSRRRIRFDFDLLNAGCLFAGTTGAGKTNVVKILALQAAYFLEGLWLSDLYKADHRHLRPLFRRLGICLIIVRSHKAKFNILQADQDDPRGHLPVALDILKRILNLPSRAMSILRSAAHQLYLQFGIYNGSDSWPTLFDLYEVVLNAEKQDFKEACHSFHQGSANQTLSKY